MNQENPNSVGMRERTVWLRGKRKSYWKCERERGKNNQQLGVGGGIFCVVIIKNKINLYLYCKRNNY